MEKDEIGFHLVFFWCILVRNEWLHIICRLTVRVHEVYSSIHSSVVVIFIQVNACADME